MQMKKATVKKMISYIKKFGISIGVASAIAGLPQASFSQSMNEYSALPPLSVQTQSQQSIMLAMSLDHQVFMKAYNDFSDLNKDGVPDNTYMEDYDYVGYFDSTLCYSYQTGIESETYFIPVGRRNEIRRCESGQWSGNFLNWATMTRIDLVRQVLYGGYRYIDDPNLTVLERSYLPHDAHSFAKYVPGDIDLDGLAVVPASNTECGDANDPRCLGYTFCNTTRPPQANIISQDVNEPPLLRVVKGNYMLWDASERYQCLTTYEHYPNRFDGYSDDGAGNNSELIDDTYAIGRESEAKPIVGELSRNIAMEHEPSGANLNSPEKSGINAFSRSPLKHNVEDYIVRVSVCEPNYLPEVIGIFDGQEIYSFECQSYQNSQKPIGLLQRYGTGASQYNVHFGLLGRSYDNNKGYGALRKNLGSFIDEINPNGTFKSLENSIVDNLDAMRIVDYLYQRGATSEWRGSASTEDRERLAQNSGTYRPEAVGYDVGCEWGRASFNAGTCRNWGNPFSLILAESFRYLTGATVANVVTERNIRSGISVSRWDPVQDNESEESRFSCPAKGVLGFNASAVSYDGISSFRNETPSSLGIGEIAENSPSLAALTNELGREAGISGEYFVGTTSSNADGLCTVKTVTNLGEVTGTCPETPRLEGGYLGAGLAKYVFDEHQVRTFGVSLTDALARILIPLDQADPVDGPAVQIVPACHNQTTGGNCALVSFKVIDDVVVETQDENSGDIPTAIRKGSYYVAWEDTEQGGDYDVDAAGVIRYELLSNGRLIVETELLYNGTPDILQFGYVISGTSSVTDGVIFPAETPGGIYNVASMNREENAGWRPTRSWCTSLNNCTPVRDNSAQRVTFSSTAGSDAQFLPSPLKLAATHGSGIGEAGHAEVSDPSQLRTRLDTILRGLFNELKPGTGAGVSTNAITGEGLILSSLYSPELVHEYEDEGGNKIKEKITWVGHLNGLFYKDGLFWENCHQPSDDVLKVITDDDCVVEIGLDEETQQTVFTRHKVTRNAEGVLSIASSTGPHPYQELQSLWSADEELSKVDQPRVQRGYNTASSRRRHILTAIAADDAVNVTSSDVIPFIADNFSEDTQNAIDIGSRNHRMLGVTDAAAAQDVVNYIRGDETLPNSRSRTLDGKTWLLGDIVHSSAALVGRPASNYDIDRIGDTTYSDFVDRYRNRRLVTYVGANDGMLHAFNGGFYNHNTDSPGYLTAPVGTTVTEHELGAELWAYVPYNLLPHLKWLKDPNYSHVYYVDAKVHTFDVNIFSGNSYSEDDYPGGWGTIIVVGMRFGGGDYSLDLGDGDERTTRSAYIIMDVTNPEEPPKLLAELTDENLGFTTGDIDIVSIRRPNATTGSFDEPAKNDWYLVFGSGPTGEGALRKATSDQNAHLFHVHLNSLVSSTVNSNGWVKKTSIPVPNSYVGGVTAADWNSDFETDMLYIGVVGADSNNRGGLFQASVAHTANTLDISAPSRLLDVRLPFSRAPLVVRDVTNNGYWVYAATGEFMVSEHLLAENIDDNWIYGIRANREPGTGWLKETDPVIGVASMKNITGVEVWTEVGDDGRIFTVRDPVLGEITPEAMELKIREGAGWSKKLSSAELAPNIPIFTGTTLAVGSFSPSVDDDCKAGGVSRLYWLNMFTGLPQTENQNIFVKDNDPNSSNASGVDSIDVGGNQGGSDPRPLSDHAGIKPGIILDGATAGTDVILPSNDGSFTLVDGGTAPPPPVRRAWREVPTSELE